ncbi:hypothetical protein GCM10023148_12570 [Actinokineospora soli]
MGWAVTASSTRAGWGGADVIGLTGRVDHTPLLRIEWPSTAPKGNGTQPGHGHPRNGAALVKRATMVNSGEAGL